MTYLCAISCCSEDAARADEVYLALQARQIGAFFYRRTDMGYGLLYGLHSGIYRQAVARLYFLREESFQKDYPTFELRCGMERESNLIVPCTDKIAGRTPEDFDFVHGPAWTWLAGSSPTEVIVAAVAEAILRARSPR